MRVRLTGMLIVPMTVVMALLAVAVAYTQPATTDATDPPKPSVQPPQPRDYASPGGVGPARGWYIWQKFDPDTWHVQVSRDPAAQTWTARVLPYATTYRYLTYGARPDELLAGERVNLFFAADENSRWGFVCHFQDELSQMKGHNHAWQVLAVADGGRQFTASVWMGNEKKLQDQVWTFTIDPKCRKWRGGKLVDTLTLSPDDRLYATWVLRKAQRVVVLLADDASLDAIAAGERQRVKAQIAAEGVAGQLEAVEGDTARLLVYATFWAQMKDFKAGQTVNLTATGKGFKPAGDPVALKLVSSKTGGPYGSGPTDVVLRIPRPADAKRLAAWLGGRVVRMTAVPAP